MIGSGRRRKDILDDNNYIGKYGKVTHVCPSCGNLYQFDCKLYVDLALDTSLCERNGYGVTTPNITKKCACGEKAIQVDNAMGIIVKGLVDKHYTVISCCEGHAYVEDAVPCFDFPIITIDGNIKSFIPTSYKSSLLIYEDFDKTVITCSRADSLEEGCPCKSVEDFNAYKEKVLELMYSLVTSLPIFSFNTENDDDSTCICGRGQCSCCKCE